MTSDKQIRANRRNALKSTGPRTPEGKAAARYNSRKHGLLSQEVLLPDEDEGAFVALSEHLRDELRPVGELENQLVDRVIAAQWRLRRLGRVEASIFTWEHYDELARQARREVGKHEVRVTGAASEEEADFVINLAKPVVRISDEQKHREATRRAEELEAKRDSGAATLGRAFTRDAQGANTFSKLSRYETAIERSLYKALHELQRLQAARRAQADVTPPMAVDVNVSGVP